EDRIRRFLDRQKSKTFSYTQVGLTRGYQTPPTYQTLHARTELGEGLQAFEKAKEAVRNWRMFDFSWIKLCPHRSPIEEGSVVGILANVCGLWCLNACRIVYVIDAHDRFGFAYGTLEDHAEKGEELFCVEKKPDGSVWYEIYSFSRPSRLAFKMASP